jgi:hypothetical protein
MGYHICHQPGACYLLLGPGTEYRIFPVISTGLGDPKWRESQQQRNCAASGYHRCHIHVPLLLSLKLMVIILELYNSDLEFP